MFSAIFNYFFKSKVPVQDPVQDQVQDPVQDPVQDQVQDPVQDPVQEPVQEPVQDPVQDQVQDPVQDPVQEPVQDPVQEPVQDPVQDHVQDQVQDQVQDPVQHRLMHLTELFNRSHRGILYEELDCLLKNAYAESPIYTLKCLAYLRSGRGERDLSKKAYRWLQHNCEHQLIKNMELFINKYGRWDDFIYLPLGTDTSTHYLTLMCKQLHADLENMKNGNKTSNVAKWIPSEKSNGHNHKEFNRELAKMMGISSGELRKTYLTPLRKYIYVETQERSEMCKTECSLEEIIRIISDSYYDDICCVEKF